VIRLFLASLVLLSATVRAADALPSDRDGGWVANVNVGVIGGIPTNRTIVATADVATYGDGVTECTAYFAELLRQYNNTGGVIFFPAGVYKFDYFSSFDTYGWAGGAPYEGHYALMENVTIRGEPGTIFKSGASGVSIGFGKATSFSSSMSISGGATKGSTTITVADTSAIQVSPEGSAYLGVISADGGNITNLNGYTTSYTTSPIGQCVKIVSKTSTTITFTPALFDDFTSTPTFMYDSSPTRATVGLGIENIEWDGDGIGNGTFNFATVYGSWIKGCTFRDLNKGGLNFYNTVNCEFRENYGRNSTLTGAGTETFCLTQYCTGVLIENNILYHFGFPQICIGNAVSPANNTGNVIAYNYLEAPNASDPGVDYAGPDISSNHGPGNIMNLIEGNTMSQFTSDGYHSWSARNAVIRNFITVEYEQPGIGSPGTLSNMVGVRLARWANYYTVAKNTIGTTQFPTSSQGHYDPSSSGLSLTDRIIFMLGYPNLGNYGYVGTWGPTTPPDYSTQYLNQPGGNGHGGEGGYVLQERDLNVAATLIRKGNYNYKDVAIPAGEDLGSDTVRDSYFRSSKPDWFGSKAWPPFDGVAIGGFNDAARAITPAGHRYAHENTSYLQGPPPSYRKGGGRVIRRR
jgi:hypothetical protein